MLSMDVEFCWKATLQTRRRDISRKGLVKGTGVNFQYSGDFSFGNFNSYDFLVKKDL